MDREEILEKIKEAAGEDNYISETKLEEIVPEEIREGNPYLEGITVKQEDGETFVPVSDVRRAVLGRGVMD